MGKTFFNGKSKFVIKGVAVARPTAFPFDVLVYNLSKPLQPKVAQRV